MSDTKGYKDWPRHPASAAWGEMSDAEFARLKVSIKADGFRPDEPVVVLGGPEPLVVDGWHRMRAAIETGMVPTVVKRTFKNAESLAAWVNSRHASRRNLPEFELSRRSVLAMKACGIEFAPARRPSKEEVESADDEGRPAFITAEAVAEQTGGSKRTAHRAIQDVKAAEARDPAAEIERAKRKAAQAASRTTAKRAAEDAAAHHRQVNEQLVEELEAAKLKLAERGGAERGDVEAEYQRLVERLQGKVEAQAEELEKRRQTIQRLEGELAHCRKYGAELEAAIQRWEQGA